MKSMCAKAQKGFAIRSNWGMTSTPLTEFAAGTAAQAALCFVRGGRAGSADCFGECGRTFSGGVVSADKGICDSHGSRRQCMAAGATDADRDGVARRISDSDGNRSGSCLRQNAAVDGAAESVRKATRFELSLGVLAFTAAAGLLTSLIAGIGPSVKMVRTQKRLELHDGGRSSTASADKQRLRSVFVIGEVAMAFVLLAGTGLFLASLRQMQQINPGFNPHGVLTGVVVYSGEGYKNNRRAAGEFCQCGLDNLKAQPGVKSAAATTSLPFSNQDGASSFNIEGQAMGPNDPGPHSQLSFATADYSRRCRLPCWRGVGSARMTTRIRSRWW